MTKKKMLVLNENIDRFSNLIFENFKDNDLKSIRIINLLELKEVEYKDKEQ